MHHFPVAIERFANADAAPRTPLPCPTCGLVLGMSGFASGESTYAGLMPQCVEFLRKVFISWNC